MIPANSECAIISLLVAKSQLDLTNFLEEIAANVKSAKNSPETQNFDTFTSFQIIWDNDVRLLDAHVSSRLGIKSPVFALEVWQTKKSYSKRQHRTLYDSSFL